MTNRSISIGHPGRHRGCYAQDYISLTIMMKSFDDDGGDEGDPLRVSATHTSNRSLCGKRMQDVT
ncbi:hypothetical protein [Nitrosospira briensis]|uniref:hypothetical protein n=1 Tax=Nitrosospira briensis TaxID=35799 RepID=UPI0012E0F795|nr:hypothetical protein [Nitrosospira briensis]